MTDSNDIEDVILNLSLATINLTDERDAGILALFELSIAAHKSQRLEIERLKDETQRLLDYPIQTDLAPISLRKLFKVEAMALAVKGRTNP